MAWSKVIWQNIAPLKVRVLVWLVVQNKLLSVDNLGKRNIRVRNFCVFCSKHRNRYASRYSLSFS